MKVDFPQPEYGPVEYLTGFAFVCRFHFHLRPIDQYGATGLPGPVKVARRPGFKAEQIISYGCGAGVAKPRLFARCKKGNATWSELFTGILCCERQCALFHDQQLI